MKQTAVEWLKLEIESIEFQDPAAGQLYLEIQPLLEQAKAMEKEQIMDAYTADCDTLGHTNAFKVAAEQYYNETFKSE